MVKILLGFQVIAASLIHLLCCGLPFLISLSGGLGLFMALQSFTPILFGLQLIVFAFTFYHLYKRSDSTKKSVRYQRIIFWVMALLSVFLFFYPPKHWFKSEETKMKQAQIERFLKHKTQ